MAIKRKKKIKNSNGNQIKIKISNGNQMKIKISNSNQMKNKNFKWQSNENFK